MAALLALLYIVFEQPGFPPSTKMREGMGGDVGGGGSGLGGGEGGALGGGGGDAGAFTQMWVAPPSDAAGAPKRRRPGTSSHTKPSVHGTRSDGSHAAPAAALRRARFFEGFLFFHL